MADVWIGWAGLVLLVVSWLPGALRTLKLGRTDAQPFFLLTYSLAAFLLMVYSVQLGDMPFILLNGLSLALVGVQVYFLLRPHKVGSKKTIQKNNTKRLG